MAGYKGVGVVFIRRLLRAAGGDVEKRALSSLSERDCRAYEACTATAWVPIALVTHLAVAAAPLLFPRERDPLDHLGRALAVDNMSGIYAFVVRVMTVEFIARQSARLWRVYHDDGEALAVRVGPRELRYDIRGYNDMPADFRRYLRGFVAQLVEMTGAVGVQASLEERADDWGYRITWA